MNGPGGPLGPGAALPNTSTASPEWMRQLQEAAEGIASLPAQHVAELARVRAAEKRQEVFMRWIPWAVAAGAFGYIFWTRG